MHNVIKLLIVDLARFVITKPFINGGSIALHYGEKYQGSVLINEW